MKASPHLQRYFAAIESEVQRAYSLAKLARAKGFDPSTEVDVKLAKNLAERVVGLISVVSPQIASAGVVERILELEKEYGTLDWRVAMVIAYEIATEKFVKFPSVKEAIEIGIRVGFAYVTVGVVSSPLEGFTSIDIKKRRDKRGDFFCMNFAGPVRNAGGTAAAVSVIIADYVRKQMGYDVYDADEKEQERCYVELMDYHERVTNLQYVPSKDEVIFLLKNLPIEISGDPSEKFEVSNFKDLPRVPANRLRSGFCLIHSSCIPLKAPKLWKNVSKWVDQMHMEDWKFLEQFLTIQKKAKAAGATANTAAVSAKITPVNTYMTDLVGGRPVIGHPLRPGGFRLRYGRARTSGFSAQAIHPATTYILDSFIAVGTQLKVERPGKATTIVTCDTIRGPIVMLEDESVEYIDSVDRAKQICSQVKRILYLGDVLICYGDFFDRAHSLVPVGYCEEWWIQEVEKALAQKTDVVIDGLDAMQKDPLHVKPSYEKAKEISTKLGVALHPLFTYYWKLVALEDLIAFVEGFKDVTVLDTAVRIPYTEKIKRALEKLGVVHSQAMHEFIIIEKEDAQPIIDSFGLKTKEDCQKVASELASKDVATYSDWILEYISSKGILQKDTAGIFIGTRMGRPEKAKMRKIAGSPYNVPPQEIRNRAENTSYVVTEHARKAEVRQNFEVNANKDGTIRYDASEAPITHFKPKEIGAPIAKLLELGYEKDIHGAPITQDNQVIELLPQDIVIPCCMDSPNEPSDDVMFRVANYVDDLLVKLYNLEPYYKLRNKVDLIGQYVFGLAPHTSAATVGRIVGFTKTQPVYCHPMFHAAMRRDCDGDETCFFLLMDGFLNFSTKFLPQHRGGTMDAPLVLTSIINPKEVDDMYFNVDIAWKYPLELYEAALQFKKPWDVKVKQVNSELGEEKQFEGIGFTHDTSDINLGATCSAYKILPSMKEKVEGQMRLAEKIDAVDVTDVAEIVINKHFLRDIMGNLRKFSQQEFRCSKCNNKFRRPPISGKCKCGSNRIIFTISKGSVIKYLELSINLGKKYEISPYIRQCLDILQYRVDGVFGKEKEKQTGLGSWV